MGDNQARILGPSLPAAVKIMLFETLKELMLFETLLKELMLFETLLKELILSVKARGILRFLLLESCKE